MTTIENAYDRFCIERFPLPSQSELTAIEQSVGVRFPESYRRFVLDFNGGYFDQPEIMPVGEGCPRDTSEFLFGINATHPEAELGRPERQALFDDNDPPKIIPIGCTGMGGLVVLDTAPGEGQGAVFLKQPFGDFYYLVDGIEAFLALLTDGTGPSHKARS